MKIKLFSAADDDILEQKVNEWLETNDVTIDSVKFQACAGGDFSYSSCCIIFHEKEVLREYTETFTETNIGFLETSVNVWLANHADKIEVLDRKFATCAPSHGDYPQERITEYSYVIVYRTK